MLPLGSAEVPCDEKVTMCVRHPGSTTIGYSVRRDSLSRMREAATCDDETGRTEGLRDSIS